MQFEAFARGFMTLCGGPAIHLFSATELERLVCGNPILDFAALQATTRYDGGYSAEHRVGAPSTDPHCPSLMQQCSTCRAWCNCAFHVLIIHCLYFAYRWNRLGRMIPCPLHAGGEVAVGDSRRV